MRTLHTIANKLFTMFNPVKMFLINLTWVLAIVIGALYVGIYYRNNTLLFQSIKDQAASYFDLILKTRTWNAEYGGVYVEKKAGVETNPHIKKLGVDPEIRAADGRILTMRNPAMMTRELSRISEREVGVQFHITSLKLVNPANKPDRFEEDALIKFERGTGEVWAIERTGDSAVFRFMKPLRIQAACLKCHSSMGHKVGDVRGGISISIPFSSVDRQMKINRWIIIAFSVLTLSIILGTLYFMASQMVEKLERAQEQLREASITDSLTGMKNRRYIMSRLNTEFHRSRRLLVPLGVIMIDIDHFKNVNDTYGHLFGDFVLKTVAQRIMTTLRQYDIAGRFGGEEFIIATPGVQLPELANLAERLCEAVRKEPIAEGDNAITVTISLGVTVVAPADEKYETVVARADNALYQAKQEGRNRVMMMR